MHVYFPCLPPSRATAPWECPWCQAGGIAEWFSSPEQIMPGSGNTVTDPFYFLGFKPPSNACAFRLSAWLVCSTGNPINTPQHSSGSGQFPAEDFPSPGSQGLQEGDASCTQGRGQLGSAVPWPLELGAAAALPRGTGHTPHLLMQGHLQRGSESSPQLLLTNQSQILRITACFGGRDLKDALPGRPVCASGAVLSPCPSEPEAC